MAWFKKSLTPEVTQAIDVPTGFHVPSKTQWAFTPRLQSAITQDGIFGHILTGTALCPQVTLHHDAADAGFSIEWAHAGGVKFDFANFAPGFFSLAFELPVEGVKALGRQDLLRIALRTRADEPFRAYVRLNLCHGPNTEKIVRMIDIADGESFAEFDIFYTDFEQRRATSAWIDLIFNAPIPKRIALEEVVILRRARASL